MYSLNKIDRELCARPSTVGECAGLFSHKSRTKFPSKSWTTDVSICSLVQRLATEDLHAARISNVEYFCLFISGKWNKAFLQNQGSLEMGNTCKSSKNIWKIERSSRDFF